MSPFSVCSSLGILFPDKLHWIDWVDQTLIFKIVSRAEWERAEAEGVFRGAAIDLQDGYIHFSTAGQVAETAAKHFADQTDLLLVALRTGDLGDKLRWEPSRGGALFPHLYAPLSLTAVQAVWPLPFEQGRHVFPVEIDTTADPKA